LPDGFTYVAKHRKKCLSKSGGIVTIFKKSLAHLLEFPEEYHNFGKYLENQGLLILTSNHKHLSNIY
jgi:hypothetical protein